MRRPNSTACFKPHQRGGGCCSQFPQTLHCRAQHVSNPISGEVGAAAAGKITVTGEYNSEFQTPSAGRWVLQQMERFCIAGITIVSNPISGEVGAAATRRLQSQPSTRLCFKPHQRGGGCCSPVSLAQRQLRTSVVSNPISGEVGAAAGSVQFVLDESAAMFQTPSAGRWVLQLDLFWGHKRKLSKMFQTPSAGRWVLQRGFFNPAGRNPWRVSNPISGEVGAAAGDHK